MIYIVLSILLIIPIVFFKSNFTKVVIFIYWYPLTIMINLYNNGIPIRIVSKYISYYDQYIGIATYSAIFSYLIFIISIWGIRKKELVNKTLPLGEVSKFVFFVFFVFFLSQAYPRATFTGAERFGSFGSLVVFLYVLILFSNKNKKHFQILTIMLAFLVFIRGERVDIILMLLLPMINMETRKMIKYFPIVIILFLLGVYSGLDRLGHYVTFDEFTNLLEYSLKNFGTAVDVVHVYFSSMYYYFEIGSNISPLVNVIASFAPFSNLGGVNSPNNISLILREYIDNLGGGLFYSVGAMILGPAGVAIFGFLYGILYRILFSFGGYFSIIFIGFWLMQFRIQWYGLTYFGNVFFMGVVFLLYLNLSIKATK